MPEIVGTISRTYPQGNDLVIQITVTDLNDAAVDITGFTTRFIAVRHNTATVGVSSEASPSTVTMAITDPTNGVYTATISNANTAGLLGDYDIESQIVDGSSNVAMVVRGYMTINDSLFV